MRLLLITLLVLFALPFEMIAQKPNPPNPKPPKANSRELIANDTAKSRHDRSVEIYNAPYGTSRTGDMELKCKAEKFEPGCNDQSNFVITLDDKTVVKFECTNKSMSTFILPIKKIRIIKIHYDGSCGGHQTAYWLWNVNY